MHKELTKLGKEGGNVKVVLSEQGKKPKFLSHLFFFSFKTIYTPLFCELKLFLKMQKQGDKWDRNV